MGEERKPLRGKVGGSDESLEMLTVAEAARELRINRKTLYELIQRGELPGVRRFGRAIRIHRHTLLQWLADQGRVPHSSARPECEAQEELRPKWSRERANCRGRGCPISRWQEAACSARFAGTDPTWR